MNRIYWAIAILIVVSAAGRLWFIASASAQFVHIANFNRLGTARAQVQQWMAAGGSRQMGALDASVEPSSMQDPQSRLSQTWTAFAETGVTQINFQRFDPDAVVLMLSGPDMHPGIAAVDDNANGIVDDASELGATGSDDVCLVQRAIPDPSDDETTLVLQHGAFVPALPSELQNRSFQWRARVRGESSGEHWSLLVEIE